MKNNPKKKLISYFLLLMICYLISGCGYATFDFINNYNIFVASLVQYEQADDEPTEPKEPIESIKPFEPDEPITPSEPEVLAPLIDGFDNLYNEHGYSYAKSFSGQYSFVVLNGQGYILSKEGTLIKTDVDLKEYNLCFDKYIFIAEDKQGVKDIFSNTVLPAEFSYIVFSNNIILAKTDSQAYIYNNSGELLCKVPLYVSLFNEKYILSYDGVYDLNFKPVNIDEYFVVNAINSSTFLINEGLLFGAADLDLNVLVKPMFNAIYNYINGWLCVKQSSLYKVISPSGEEVFSSTQKIPLYCDGKYIIYQQLGSIGIIDIAQSYDSGAQFLSIKDNKIYNDYLIVGADKKQLYSLKENKLVDGEYLDIIAFDNYFIFQKVKDSFTLVDKDLNILIDECKSIDYSNDILCVQNIDGFFFYSKSN